MTPILVIGAGRMGGALIAGWRRTRAFAPRDLMIVDPTPGEAARTAITAGVAWNPAGLTRANTVVLSVKPQDWLEAAQISDRLDAEAVIVSIAAGVRTADIAAAFGGRRVARVMPTTAAAIGQGTASLFADDPEALERARALFAPVGTVVELASEELMHAATAVSGSAPAYLYAFVEALEAAGAKAGLAPQAAQRLARATIAGAAALMAAGDEDPAELRRQVTSKAGTTEAALAVLMGEGGLGPLLDAAVAAAAKRSRELGG